MCLYNVYIDVGNVMMAHPDHLRADITAIKQQIAIKNLYL